MVKPIKKLPDFTGAAASGTATLRLPRNRRYHVLWLEVKNNHGTAANNVPSNTIAEIRVIFGAVQRRITGDRLDLINKLYGAQYAYQQSSTAVAFMLPIFFAEPFREEYNAKEAFAWNVGAGDEVVIEVDFMSATTVTTPTISAWAEYDSLAAGVRSLAQQLIAKWITTSLPVNGTNPRWNQLPKREAYASIHIFDNAIQDVKVELDETLLREVPSSTDRTRGKIRNDAVLTSRGMVPVATRFDLLFDYDDLPQNVLPMQYGTARVSEFVLDVLTSSGTARDIPVVYQLIGPPDTSAAA